MQQPGIFFGRFLLKSTFPPESGVLSKHGQDVRFPEKKRDPISKA
jgi:hypothetical protein